jgi:hypothetical protein
LNRIELSGFSLVKSRTKTGGRMLRFTLTWAAGHPEDPYAISLVGCLCKRSGLHRQLMWTPPMSTWKGGIAVQSNVINTRMYEDVLKAIEGTDYAEQIGDGVPDFLKAEEPGPEMPKQIKIEGEKL